MRNNLQLHWARLKAKLLSELQTSSNYKITMNKFAVVEGLRIETVQKWYQELLQAELIQSENKKGEQVTEKVRCSKCNRTFHQSENKCPYCEIEEHDKKITGE